MAIKSLHYSQFADLRIEGVGIHASFSVKLTVYDEKTPAGKQLSVSATGATNAARAAGNGHVLFWCKVRDLLSNREYSLQRQSGEYVATGNNDIFIGTTRFLINSNTIQSPKIEITAGYIYESGYTGSAVPIPSSLRKTILLTPFSRG